MASELSVFVNARTASCICSTGMEPAEMSVLRRITSDPFSRRMLYFSIAYSLYLAVPLSWGFYPADYERVNPAVGYEFSGYYGIVTAVIGFLCALTCKDRTLFPNTIVAKLILLGFFIHSTHLILRLTTEVFYYVFSEPDGYMILDFSFLGIGFVCLVLSPFLLLAALFTSPRTAAGAK